MFSSQFTHTKLADSWPLLSPVPSKMSLTIVTCQTSGQNETSDHLVQGIYREEKGGSYAAGFVDTPPKQRQLHLFRTSSRPASQPMRERVWTRKQHHYFALAPACSWAGQTIAETCRSFGCCFLYTRPIVMNLASSP